MRNESMVTPTYDISDYLEKDPAARRHRADGECLRYRLDVIAVSAIDVAQAAGGWLYDRVMAGWEVTALLPDGCDTRPLQILGVRTSNLDMELASGFAATGPMSQSLAVSAEAFSADDRVRERVRRALDHRLTEVALWGDGWPLGTNRGMTRVQHVLSAAARAFKTHALVAAGVSCPSTDPTESLLCDVTWSG
jgi:hypothetical protein